MKIDNINEYQIIFIYIYFLFLLIDDIFINLKKVFFKAIYKYFFINKIDNILNKIPINHHLPMYFIIIIVTSFDCVKNNFYILYEVYIKVIVIEIKKENKVKIIMYLSIFFNYTIFVNFTLLLLLLYYIGFKMFFYFFLSM